jgi:hypothetical protein
VDAANGTATLVVTTGREPGEASDIYSMLTISAALLLGRRGRALTHAAAVVSPSGEAWLLAGDARSGKSTTAANFLNQGWRYLSDDQVVLRAEQTAIVVDGLPRPFHLDRGWGSQSPAAIRSSVDSTTRWPGQLMKSAPLGGLFLPRVVPDKPTTFTLAPQGDGITGLIRQSPWLLADPVAAPALLALLQRVAAESCYDLSLGLDTFGNSELLESRFRDTIVAPARSAARPARRAIGDATPRATA